MTPLRPPVTRRGPGPAGRRRQHLRHTGFTLVEVVVTMVIMGVLAATATLFYKPVVEIFLGQRNRSQLLAETGIALQLMLRDVRAAVPNSIRSPSSDCFETIPTRSGGRYRMGLDTVAGGAQAVDPSTTTTSFDVLTPLAATPAVGDWVVVDNENPADVYAGTNRSAITSVSTPAATAGTVRLGIDALQFPAGYDGGRFVVVPNADKAVFYVCSGASTTLDSRGDAPGVLVRLKNYGFNAATPGACPSIAGGDVVVRNVRSCRFLYTANQGATQQSGFISLQLELTRGRESASLLMGAHVVNQP